MLDLMDQKKQVDFIVDKIVAEGNHREVEVENLTMAQGNPVEAVAGIEEILRITVRAIIDLDGIDT